MSLLNVKHDTILCISSPDVGMKETNDFLKQAFSRMIRLEEHFLVEMCKLAATIFNGLKFWINGLLFSS